MCAQPRLQMLCDMHSKLISYSSLYDDDDEEQGTEDQRIAEAAEMHEGGRFAAISVDLLPCTLARDLSRLVGIYLSAPHTFLPTYLSIYLHIF